MIDHNRPAVSPVPIIFLIIMNAFISSSFVFWLTLALTCWAEISVVGRLVLGAARYWAKGSGGGWRYHERFLHSAPTTTTTTTTTSSSSYPAQQRPGESFLSQLLITDIGLTSSHTSPHSSPH